MKLGIHRYKENKFLKIELIEEKPIMIPIKLKSLFSVETFESHSKFPNFQIVVENFEMQGDGFLVFVAHILKKGYKFEIHYGDSFNQVPGFAWKLRTVTRHLT